MLNKIRIAILLAAVSTAGFNNVFAQPSRVIIGENGPKTGLANSPLSRIGVGNWLDPSNSMIKGMGGIATAYNNPFAINKMNPATYGFTKITTFDLSVQAYSNNIFLNDNSLKSSTYTINSIAFAIPAGKYFGLSFGYHPKSTVYYDAAQQDVIAGLDTVNRMYYGYGALHDLYLGGAFKYKGFALGLNANYIFGSILNSSAIESVYLINPSYTNSEFYSVNTIRGLQFQLGAIYQHTLKDRHYLQFGAAYDLKAGLNTSRDFYAMQYQYAVNGSSVTTDPIDTMQSLSLRNAKGKLTLPSGLSLGVHMGRSGHWNAGVDFRTTQWSEFAFNNDRSGVAASTYRLGIGGEMMANPEATENVFLNNIVFRLGAYYGTDYAVLGNQVYYYGGTFSIGLPLFRSYGTYGTGLLNTTFDIGTASNGAPDNAVSYTNRYFKFTLGFNFNDVWFKKRKFE